VDILSKIRHPNLLSLRAFYWGPKQEKLLVFDYMRGGSLARLLHGSLLSLSPSPMSLYGEWKLHDKYFELRLLCKCFLQKFPVKKQGQLLRVQV
jgi:serine/threonine protein kinase